MNARLVSRLVEEQIQGRSRRLEPHLEEVGFEGVAQRPSCVKISQGCPENQSQRYKRQKQADVKPDNSRAERSLVSSRVEECGKQGGNLSKGEKEYGKEGGCC